MRDILLLAMIPVSLCFVCFMTGHLLGVISKKSFDAGEKVIIGYVVCVGALQVIAIPFMYFSLDFLPLYYIYLLIIVSVILVSCFSLYHYRRKEISNLRRVVSTYKRADIYLWGILILGIAFQIIYVVLHQHTDIDDSFYIAETNTILSQGKVLDIDPASGLSEFPFAPTYKMVSYEVLLAVIVKIFSVNAAYLCHTILPVFLIALHYLIIINIAKKISPKNAVYFIFLYQVINMFSAYSGYSQGAFLLYRIWQGKAVMINIVIPILILTFFWIYEKKIIEWKEVLFVTVVLIAGFHTTTVAIYLVPVAYFGLVAGYLYSNQKWGNIIKLCVPVILILPLVGLKFWILISIPIESASGEQTSAVASAGSGASNLSYLNEFVNKYMDGNIILLFLIVIALLYLIFKGNQKEKGIIAVPAIVIWLTFCNPVFMKIVAGYVTGSAVYWRLFWLLEFPMIVVAATTKVIGNITTREVYSIASAAGAIAVAVNGTYIFDERGFTERQNKYKLDSISVTIADMVLNDAKEFEDDNGELSLLLPVEISYGIREYTGEISLILNRYSQGTFVGNGQAEEWNRLNERLIQLLYADKKYDISFKEELDYFNIDYVVLFTESLEEKKNVDGLDYVGDCANYSIYRIEE